MSILEVKGLHHDFKGLKVLTGIDLEVEKGERHAIIGPNGAGKTTLFNIITGTYSPPKGQIFFRGTDITGYPPHQLVRLGMGRSFQITSTFSGLTAFQNIRMGILSSQGVRFNMLHMIDRMKAITRDTDKMLQSIDLQAEREMPAGMLSYGKNRALEIGMALATSPSLIMLDEPTAGMSVDETHTAVELIRDLTVDKTLVIIEHDMDVVFSLADRITVLHLGKVLASGSPEQIRANTAVKDAYLGNLEA
jgi:branched-chain amino acid transport system ATP-binding protein